MSFDTESQRPSSTVQGSAKNTPDRIAKSLIQFPKRILQKSFGFFDYIFIWLIIWTWFFFTGIAVARGKSIPASWSKILPVLRTKEIKDRIKKNFVEPAKPQVKTKVVTVGEELPQDLLKKA